MTLASLPINKGHIQDVLFAAVDAGMGKLPVGDAKAPPGVTDRSTWLVLERITTGRGRSGRFTNQGLLPVKFQLRGVSPNRSAADKALARAEEFVFGVDAGGSYLNDLVCDHGHTIIHRDQTLSIAGSDDLTNSLIQFDLWVNRQTG